MSGPILPASSILSAARAAGDAASQFAGKLAAASGFDDLLRQAEPPAAPPLEPMTEKAVSAIRTLLGQFGIDANPPIELAVQKDGRVRVEGNHDRAARMEAILGLDRELTDLLENLHAAAAVQQAPLRLTIGPGDNDLTRWVPEETIKESPGG